MDEPLKQRLVGAVVLVSAAVIFVPMIFDAPDPTVETTMTTPIPQRSSEGFTSRVVPLDEPVTPSLDERVARERASDPVPAESAEPEANEPRAGVVKPVPRPEPVEAEPEPEPRRPASGWAVQLGSFSNSKNALALRDRLRSKGYAAFVETAYADRGEITRVFVGPELDRERARKAVKKLEGETKLKGIVIRYPGR